MNHPLPTVYEMHQCRDCEVFFKRRFISENAYREKWYLDANGQKTKGNKCHACYRRTQDISSASSRTARKPRKKVENRYLMDHSINAHCKPCKICRSLTANYFACDTCWKNNRGSVNTQDVPNFTKTEMASVYAPLDKGNTKK